MRIAARGHDIWGDDDDDDVMYGTGRSKRSSRKTQSRAVSGMPEKEGKRKRHVTMQPDRMPPSDTVYANATEVDGEVEIRDETELPEPTQEERDRSARATLLILEGNMPTDLGPPITSTNDQDDERDQGISPSGSPRDTSSKTFQAPRSSSLNVLASATNIASPSSSFSRQGGVAAHFVPPENKFTPSKDANWDEVVLPTVAKKLDSTDGGKKIIEGDVGDLAVEWDRDGTPVRWVKKDLMNTTQILSVSCGRRCSESICKADGIAASESNRPKHKSAPSPSRFLTHIRNFSQQPHAILYHFPTT